VRSACDAALSIRLRVVPSKYADQETLIVSIEGVDVVRQFVDAATADRARQAIEEFVRREEQLAAYGEANQRLTETVQSLQRVLWFGLERLPKIDPLGGAA
jgi:hypothetical protein